MAKAVMIYGAPGAGKGTQANLLAWSRGWIHFDTGKFFEQYLHDPANQKNPQVRRERKNFAAGLLVTPTFTLKIVSRKTQEIAKAGFSVVFSGSPRTLYEAFGDAKTPGLIEILEKAYGRKNMHIIFLKVKPESSIFRNSNRLICSECANAILYSDTHQHVSCPICGAKLRRRVLDKPAIIKVRLKEYRERTLPILNELKKHGYKIIEVSGEPKPNAVFNAIKRQLKI